MSPLESPGVHQAMEMKIIKDFPIRVDEKEVLRLLGYRKKEADRSTLQLLKEKEKELPELISPKAVYAIFDKSNVHRHPVFKGAEKVALCICTIGPSLERKVTALMNEGNLLEGVILDALGSEATEEVANYANTEICREIDQLHLFPSRRFSPGYGKWGIEEQRLIFSLLPGKTIDVQLNPSCMMVPRKSISFAVNLLSHPDPRLKKSPCHFCQLPICPYRKDEQPPLNKE